MALRLYNSLTRKLDELKPLVQGLVGIYVCGMTPSSNPHLGHARTFLTFDVLRRHLSAKGLAVTYVQNVTDIDDKIIDRARKDGTSWDAVVNRFFGEYEACAKRLGLKPPDVEPRATREIPAIVEVIAGLIARGAAYESGDGVYFSVESDPHYGELSGQKIEDLRAGVRMEVREDKRSPLDFALWKKAKPGEPTWPSPWGEGRPGWHVECSAMARRYLGDQIDIHGGAADLIFPHHENEVAQTECFTGKHPMANIWMHAGLLMVDGQKMSKSLNNFIPLTELLERHSTAAVRYLFLQTGYRKPTNFTEEAIDAAAKGLHGLYQELDDLRKLPTPSHVRSAGALAPEDFDAFLDDDLNTGGAVAWLQTQVRDARRKGDASILGVVQRCLDILGLPRSAAEADLERKSAVAHLSDEARAMLRKIAGDAVSSDTALIERVIALRNVARASKNFAQSDALRNALSRAGISVKDTPAGSEWSFDAGR
ncbi:MAG TPA: cysteine--tRNA ligase [Candidatus Tumulicola sp.]|nr:cysteine--tRNA ligase [Candidatus Tumulicola sp.]